MDESNFEKTKTEIAMDHLKEESISSWIYGLRAHGSGMDGRGRLENCHSIHGGGSHKHDGNAQVEHSEAEAREIRKEKERREGG
jgi:hypothetical protein